MFDRLRGWTAWWDAARAASLRYSAEIHFVISAPLRMSGLPFAPLVADESGRGGEISPREGPAARSRIGGIRMQLAKIRSLVASLILLAAVAAPAKAQLPWQAVATPIYPQRIWLQLVPPPLRHGEAAQVLERMRIDLWRICGQLRAMQGIAIEASNGLLTEADRALLNVQFQARKQRIADIAAASQVNGLALLDGTHSYVLLQIRPARLEFRQEYLQDVRPTALGIESADVITVANSGTALAACDSALDSVAYALLQRRAAAQALGL